MANNNKNKNPNVPPLRFPEFKGEWKQCKIGEDCEVNMCKRIMAAQTNKESGVPFYKIGTIGATADAYISRLLFDEYKAKYNYPQKGEVMITCAGTVGKCMIFNGEDSYFQDSNIVWINNPTSYITNDFLYYKLSTINLSRLNSTTIIRIYNDDLRNLKINYPSIEEQRKIIKILRLIDERIATQKKIIEKQKSLIKGILEFHYHSCDKHQCMIKDLGEPFSVMNLSKDDLSVNGKKCILYGELFNTYNCVITDVNSKTKVSENLSLSQKGDLLFPSSTTVDAISLVSPSAITQENIILGGDMFGIHITRDYSNEYLSYFFNYLFRREIAKYAIGSTIIHLHYHDIKNIHLLIPDKKEQIKVAAILRCVQSKIDTEINYFRTLIKMKHYILSNMFI